MHIVLAVIGAIGAAYYFVWRARNAAEMTHELLDVANDVHAAARRIGFSRRKNQHPVEGIEQPELAIATIACAFLELAGLPTQEQKDRLVISLRKNLRASDEDVTEHMVVGHWLVQECQGAGPAIERTSRKLMKLSGADHWEPLMATLKDIIATQDDMTARQGEALQDIKRAFRIK